MITQEMEAALKVRQEKLEEALSAETIATSLMNARNNSLRSECHKLQEMEKQLIEVSVGEFQIIFMLHLLLLKYLCKCPIWNVYRVSRSCLAYCFIYL